MTVRGEIDLATAPKLAGLLGELIDRGGRSIAIDLGSVEFMDSTGIRTLVDAAERLGREGGDFVVLAVSAPVQKVLALTGVDRILRPRNGAADIGE